MSILVWGLFIHWHHPLFETFKSIHAGKSVSEALILESVNPQYDDRLFIDLQFQYKKNTSSEHVVYKNCFLFWHSKQLLYTTCSEFVFFWVRSCKSMNNLSSYCGLTDSRMSASDTDLPVPNLFDISMCTVLMVDLIDGNKLKNTWHR